MPKLQRKKCYNQLYFSIELIRQLSGIEKKHPVPLYTVLEVSSSHNITPQYWDKHKNCKRRHRLYRKEVKTRGYVLCIYVSHMKEIVL